jgi:hypothetical protein
MVDSSNSFRCWGVDILAQWIVGERNRVMLDSCHD